MSMPADTPRVPRCPICKKAAVDPFRPFCSRRCADVDLHRWFSGVYAVPAEETDDEDSLAEGDRPAEPDERH
jgi:endogenous inhibitor of DNA gyrase (YacG/DUF329 family)